MTTNLKKTSTVKKQTAKKSALPFTAENYYIFFAGILVIIIGYICMNTGPVYGAISMTIAPILVSIGYLVLIPLSILYRKKENLTNPQP
ncbi:DUF3098 domain-containing protein [bacterium]|nr:DUF3098 domain-containing protein [bacterium]